MKNGVSCSTLDELTYIYVTTADRPAVAFLPKEDTRTLPYMHLMLLTWSKTNEQISLEMVGSFHKIICWNQYCIWPPDGRYMHTTKKKKKKKKKTQYLWMGVEGSLGSYQLHFVSNGTSQCAKQKHVCQGRKMLRVNFSQRLVLTLVSNVLLVHQRTTHCVGVGRTGTSQA